MKTLAISLFVILSSFSVMAADTFATLDVDKNGAISKDEAKEDLSLLVQFNDLDKDNNGELSKKEFADFKLS